MELCEGIATAADVAFFCDNSIFEDPATEDLWPALFDREGKAFITPRIAGKLQPWLDKRPGHPVSAALQGDAPKLRLMTAADWGEAEQQTFIHYTNILAIRKRMMRWGAWEFERAHGRPALESDRTALQTHVQKAVGERGFMFAKKGGIDSARRKRSFADEEVVYTAVAHAIRTGRQAVILTKDEDLLDQFYRLIYLLDTHYRSMLIAGVYRSDFRAFRSHPMPTTGEWADAFVGDSKVLVEPDEDLPNRVLPSRPHFVAVSCWLVGQKYQALTFGAEQEMMRLINVKGQTRGRNTDLLGERNCHLLLAGLPEPRKDMPPCFAVARDQTHDIAGQRVPHLEAVHAVMDAERFKRIEETPLPIPGRSIG